MAELMTRMWHPFEDPFFRSFLNRMVPEDKKMDVAGDNLPLDVFEKDHQMVVKAHLPEVDKKDIKISVDGDMLKIAAEKHEEKEVKEESYYLKEYRAGMWRRTIRLPQTVDFEKATATYENGMLMIAMPMKEAAKARNIELKT
jgi:HSP20 family protein